ncbi:MAG: DHH family phosphoesterase [Bacteroidales bacterium]|nr:DHH family phosphoesterase [Bacteroidales bacterium]
MKKEIEVIKKKLPSAKNIAILCHVHPDGDTIGSALALFHYFKSKGKNVNVISPNDYHKFLDWMPESDKISVYSKSKNKNEIEAVIMNADVVFCIDFNASNRIDELEPFYLKSKAFKILIDHHALPKKFSDITISDTHVSSTAELIYDFLIGISGNKKSITKEIGECLYVGILTDTGSFSYSCSYKTHFITSELIKAGVNTNHVNQLVYSHYSEERIRLLGYCLSEKLVVMNELKTAYFSLTRDEQIKYKYRYGDTEGIVNYALSINGINLAAIIVERTGEIKFSFRSKGDFDVSKMAREYYNGGGHNNAAGGFLKVTLNEAVEYFVKIVKKYPKI